MKSINPKNSKIINEYEAHSDDQAFDIVKKADIAQKAWKDIDLETRKLLMLKAAKILIEDKARLALLITNEMGKVLKESEAEIEKCALTLEYYAKEAENILEDQFVRTEFSKSYISFKPLGVILAVMPWNFPFWQVLRFAAPALMAGNGAVLKHASNVSGCALAIEEIFIKAGFPKDLFRTLLIKSDQVGRIIENPIIKAVTFTGSEKAGAEVAKKAGSVLKKAVLELGGSDAYIILRDADIDDAVENCVKSRLINAGQSCIAAKRFIVEAPVYDEFIDKFMHKFSQIKYGDPLESSNNMGPLSSKVSRDEIHQKVEYSIKFGAKLIMGGYIPEMEGAYYPPTILVDVAKGMPAYSEELFGPVASIIKVKNEDEAIKIANDTDFGLGSCVFSKDINKAEDIAANRLESGVTYVNLFVRSDPRLPFGGVKNSGFGRELGAVGMLEFVNIKTICLK